jgi:hypothetical protein
MLIAMLLTLLAPTPATASTECAAIVVNATTGGIDTAEYSTCEAARSEAMSQCRFWASSDEIKAQCKLLGLVTDPGWWGVSRWSGGYGYGFQLATGGEPRSRVVEGLMARCKDNGHANCEVRATGRID